MTHDQLTFGDCAELLRMNGFVPAPLSPDTGRPLGPFAVMQIPYARNESNNTLPVGVLTHVPLPLSSEAPVQDPRATYLVTITVGVRPELAGDVGAIVKRYIGESCPARVETDGSRRYVLRLAGDGFSAVSTDYNEQGDFVRVNGGPDFVPLAGEWLPGAGGLLTAQRSELPEIDHARATALVAAANAILDKHAPPVSVPARYAPKPLPDLAKGERVEFGNRRAVEQMEGHGYDVCPITRDNRASDAWYTDFMNRIVWSPETHSLGLGIFRNLNSRERDRGLVTLEISGRPDLVAVADAALTKRLGIGPVRVAADGTRLRLFRASSTDKVRDSSEHITWPGPYVAGAIVRLGYASGGLVVVAGADADAQPYSWPNGSPLSVPRDQLPELAASHIEWIRCDLEAALQTIPASTAEPVSLIRGRKRA